MEANMTHDVAGHTHPAPDPPKSIWTEARIAELSRLWADGFSATQIGAEMGLTRGSVIGKIFRLKLPHPDGKRLVKRRSYPRQAIEITRANAKARAKRHYDKRRRREKEITLAKLRAKGVSPTSVFYRLQLPAIPEMTKGELRAMLAQAVQNTAAL